MLGKLVEIIAIYTMLLSEQKVLTLILYYGEKQKFLDARKFTINVHTHKCLEKTSNKRLKNMSTPDVSKTSYKDVFKADFI